MARAITLIDKEMMKEIFNERLRDKKTGMITVYEEFQEEIMQYAQRNRAVNAMLGPGSSPTPPPARAPPPVGAGRGLGELCEGGETVAEAQSANSQQAEGVEEAAKEPLLHRRKTTPALRAKVWMACRNMPRASCHTSCGRTLPMPHAGCHQCARMGGICAS